jgi:hypothetical protein
VGCADLNECGDELFLLFECIYPMMFSGVMRRSLEMNGKVGGVEWICFSLERGWYVDG